jgi:hypothetical protein
LGLSRAVVRKTLTMMIGELTQESRRRRLVAFFGHAPALWLIYREPLPRRLRLMNVVAAAATSGLVVAAYQIAAPPWRVPGALAVWLIGHFAWGLYLASRVSGVR